MNPEMIVVGIGAIALIVAMLGLDKLINGEDASNTWRRRDDR